MHNRISASDCRNVVTKTGSFTTHGHVAFVAAVTILGLVLTAVDPGRVLPFVSVTGERKDGHGTNRVFVVSGSERPGTHCV